MLGAAPTGSRRMWWCGKALLVHLHLSLPEGASAATHGGHVSRSYEEGFAAGAFSIHSDCAFCSIIFVS